MLILVLFGCQTYAYDAVWSVALALSKAEQDVDGWLEKDCGGAYINCHGPELMNLIRSGSFRGASGLVQFNSGVRRAALTCPICRHSPASLDESLTVDPCSQVDDDGKMSFFGDRDSSKMEMPLQFYNSTLREWVMAGVISPDGLVLQRPLEWPGHPDFQGIPEDGASCEAGWHFDSSSLTCVKCKPGWFSITSGQSQCHPCQPGTYCGKEGCKVRA